MAFKVAVNPDFGRGIISPEIPEEDFPKCRRKLHMGSRWAMIKNNETV